MRYYCWLTKLFLKNTFDIRVWKLSMNIYFTQRRYEWFEYGETYCSHILWLLEESTKHDISKYSYMVPIVQFVIFMNEKHCYIFNKFQVTSTYIHIRENIPIAIHNSRINNEHNFPHRCSYKDPLTFQTNRSVKPWFRKLSCCDST